MGPRLAAMARPAGMRAEALTEAARVIGRVVRSGAYLNVAVDHETTSTAARAVAYAAARRLQAIDRAIEQAAGRSLTQIDPVVLDLLRVAAASMEGNPPALVVDAAVHAMRQLQPRAAGFANAVLRRVAESGLPPPTPNEGVPEWLSSRMAGVWGPEEADAFWLASKQPPRVGVRLRSVTDIPLGCDPVPGIPGALLCDAPPTVAGAVIQDPASVAVVLAAGVGHGDIVVEVGAAPGGKTLHLLETGAAVVAIDIHPRRVRSAQRRAAAAQWIVADGRQPPLRPHSCDAVLIDAPCSGLGTLRRRPEILHRVTLAEVERLAVIQRELVEASLDLARGGGRLVYSVCTVTPEETIEIIDGLGFHPADLPIGRVWGDGRLLAPHLGPTDAMFIAVKDC